MNIPCFPYAIYMNTNAILSWDDCRLMYVHSAITAMLVHHLRTHSFAYEQPGLYIVFALSVCFLFVCLFVCFWHPLFLPYTRHRHCRRRHLDKVYYNLSFLQLHYYFACVLLQRVYLSSTAQIDFLLREKPSRLYCKLYLHILVTSLD